MGFHAAYAAAQYLDSGLAYGPGGVLFANDYVYNTIYEFKPGSATPDLTVDLTALGYPRDLFGSLQFVPPGFPGAGHLKVADFKTGKFGTPRCPSTVPGLTI